MNEIEKLNSRSTFYKILIVSSLIGGAFNTHSAGTIAGIVGLVVADILVDILREMKLRRLDKR